MEVQFEVASDLYDAGARDDGTRFEGERYFVQATLEDGSRYRYFKQWDGVKATPNHEDGGNFFEDIRPRAIALAEAVCRSVTKRPFDPKSYEWEEARPCYGSAAFMDLQDFYGNPDLYELAQGFTGNY